MTPAPGPEAPHGLDALLPAEMARRAEAIGARKARLDVASLLVLAILAGAFIGLGAMFATTTLVGAEALPYGVGRLLAGGVFSLGLILVVLGGAELFTGNSLMVMAWGAGEVGLGELLRAWSIVYVGNFIGAAGTALLVFLAGQHLFADGAVAEAAWRLAAAKLALPTGRAFFLAILCNVLVCLAVWLSIGGRTTTDKLLAVIFPVSAFVAAGFEHSVANMYLVPLALMIQDWGSPDLLAAVRAGGPDVGLTWGAFLAGLVPVTLGNMVGGGVLVGGVYWFIYLRPRKAP
jgi:formate/nitrite transporter